MSRLRTDRGSIAVECLILAPVLFVLIDLAIYAGSVAFTRAAIHRSAEVIGRERTMTRSGSSAVQGYNTAQTMAFSQGFLRIKCNLPTSNDGFGDPIGQPTAISDTFTCWVEIPGITIPGFPKQVKVTETVNSSLDTYRWRTP